MRVNTGARFTLRPTAEQRDGFARHAGARRFAFNWCVANNKEIYEKSKKDKRIKVPRSAFDNIKAFNAYKVSPEAGPNNFGSIGLSWRHKVHQQVFEEAAQDFARALNAAIANVFARRQKLTTFVLGFPDFQSRFGGSSTFRFRNSTGKLIDVRKHAIKVPHFGWLRVREQTTRLRKLLHQSKGASPGRILSATIHLEDDYWRLSLALEVDNAVVSSLLSPSVCRMPRYDVVGCDLGIKTLLTLATPDGKQAAKRVHPQLVACKSRSIPKLHRRVSIKKNAREKQEKADGKRRAASGSEEWARARLRRRYRRQRNVRLQTLHKLTSSLALRCGVIGIENLRIPNMLKNHALAGAIARQGWGAFRAQLTYKAAWTGARLIVVDSFFPSTKRCSRCHRVEASVPLEQRIFICNACGYIQDRDVNGAMNVGQAAQQISDAGPEVPGQGKPLALRKLEKVIVTSRGDLPDRTTCPVRSSNSIGGLTRPAKARKGGVELVNAP